MTTSSVTTSGNTPPIHPGMQPHAPSWEHFSHQTDMIGVRGYGHCPEEAFAQAALAMIALIADPRRIQPHETLSIECRAPDLALLLVDWLNALSYEIATHQVLFCAFDIHINGHHLHATAWGEAIDPARHQLALAVKGATLTELRVEPLDAEHWLAQCVIDV